MLNEINLFFKGLLCDKTIKVNKYTGRRCPYYVMGTISNYWVDTKLVINGWIQLRITHNLKILLFDISVKTKNCVDEQN